MLINVHFVVKCTSIEKNYFQQKKFNNKIRSALLCQRHFLEQNLFEKDSTFSITVKLGYNELGYNELPVITNKFSPFFQSQIHV